MNRLYNLDYLRGLAAFSIMIYHYLSWTIGKFNSESFMGRLGIYGVSIFYVLSGLTLYFVYYKKMSPTKAELIAFFKKRIFRIFPLLWLVTIAAIIISKKQPDIINLFLNLTGLFGFIRWNSYFSAGIWSIGNELVFYTFFPFFILFLKKFKSMMMLLSLIISGLFVYFSFFYITPELGLSPQWKYYINPLNQVFLFLGGFLIGHYLHKYEFNNLFVYVLLLIGFIIFIYYPAKGDLVNLVTGVNRMVFTAICFLICIGFYKLKIKLPSILHQPLTLLGEASYSVYLLHPIIWGIAGLAIETLGPNQNYISPSLKFIISAVITLITSYFVYEYFEKYFIKLGKSIQQ